MCAVWDAAAGKCRVCDIADILVFPVQCACMCSCREVCIEHCAADMAVCMYVQCAVFAVLDAAAGKCGEGETGARYKVHTSLSPLLCPS